ncbi:energy transducer TonB [Algoriphagus winogradskyi]|uniref:TonB family C-terminal domain-containing protein n=1 Tax=Algoriphagus winogradskyi TaxID=237017 RepID=A0ABY1PI38_9BACT|nr:energy transducer TonB [Algoriphagus winogradskyi]SMP33142.1 TonB family C-terminal domain-containing protein [Algoriphagus winogradskyi]
MKRTTHNFPQKVISILSIFLLLLVFLPIQLAQAQTEEEKNDIMPIPPGGIQGWYSYLGENLKYPESAKEKGVEGVVIVELLVKTDGSIDNVSVVRGIGGGCDEEAMRVIQKSSNWTPGEKDGKPVNTVMKIPIKFALS